VRQTPVKESGRSHAVLGRGDHTKTGGTLVSHEDGRASVTAARLTGVDGNLESAPNRGMVE